MKWLLAVLLMAAVAWGQGTTTWRIHDPLWDRLDSIILRLDHIESRLDAKPKTTGVTWSVEQDDAWGTSWTIAGEPIKVKTGTAWYLFVRQGSRKFRVCKVEEVTK